MENPSLLFWITCGSAAAWQDRCYFSDRLVDKNSPACFWYAGLFL
jgi:hypothetical protein